MRRYQQTTRPRSVRHTVDIPCQIVRERDFRLVGDRIVNLSNTGMLVTPADPVLTGERLIASFRVPGSNYWIDVEATVSRVVHGRRPGEHSRAIALEFDGLDALSKLVLECALLRVPCAPPGTRPGRRSTTEVLQAFFRSLSGAALPPRALASEARRLVA
jgi:PilZ domain